jgi:hypothetical protein
LLIEAGSVNFKTMKTSSFVSLTSQIKYSITALFGIDWDYKLSAYVENPGNWIFL